MALSFPKIPSAPDEPIATDRRAPIAYEVLGLQVHLEELTPDDEERLDAAMKYVEGWIGSRLTWAHSTARGETEGFSRESLELVTTYPRRLVIPPDSLEGIPREQLGEVMGLFLDPAAEYGVACGSSPIGDHEHAQFTSFRFYADVTRLFPDKKHLSPYSVLRVTVPSDTPLAELEQHARALVELLPVRWAGAGLMLSGAEGKYWKTWKKIAFAYCARHWGVDVGEYVALTEEFYDSIRTVNWLTFLGTTMRRDLEAAGVKLEAPRGATMEELPGGTVLLKAGASPQRGDINRLEIPRAYAAVDGLVRPRRCNGEDFEGEQIGFFEAWTVSRTRDWVRRFEAGA